MKGADQVLAGPQIHSGLAADAGVQLSDHGGWNLDYRHAPHEDRSQKAGSIANDASAKGNPQRLAVSAGLDHLLGQLFHGGYVLSRLSIVGFKYVVGELGPAQRGFQLFSPVAADIGRSNDKHSRIFRRFRWFQQPSSIAQQTIADDHVVAVVAEFDFDFLHL